MPLSKKRNKERMRAARLKQSLKCEPKVKIVQPKIELDADGNIVPDYD